MLIDGCIRSLASTVPCLRPRNHRRALPADRVPAMLRPIVALALLVLPVATPDFAAAQSAAATPTPQGGTKAEALRYLLEAQRAAAGIKGVFQKARTLRAIAAAQTRAGDKNGAGQSLAQAKAATTGTGDALHAAIAWRDIAATQAEAGDVAVARATAAGIEIDPGESSVLEYKSEAFRDIALVQAKAGDREGARQSLALAKGTVGGTRSGDPQDKDHTLIEVAVAQARIGDISEAKSTAAEIKTDTYRDSAFGEIAAAQAWARDIPGAKATAARMGSHLGRDHVMIRIAAAQAHAGDVAAAKVTVAREIEHDFDKAWALRAIAAVQAQAGDKKGAQETLAEARAGLLAVEDEMGFRAGKLLEVAIAQARISDPDAALATAAGVKDDGGLLEDMGVANDGKGEVWRSLVAAYAKAGDIANAKAITARIKLPYDKAEALIGVALVQARMGDRDGARQSFAQAKEAAAGTNESSSYDLAAAQARTGELVEAKATAARIEDPGYKAMALRDLAAAQAKAEGFPAAEAWVKTLSDADGQARCYTALAILLLDPNAPIDGDNERESITDRASATPAEDRFMM